MVTMPGATRFTGPARSVSMQATIAPARFTTAPAPAIDQGAVPKRGSLTTSSPRSASTFVNAVPINPLAPAIATFMRYSVPVNELCWVSLQVADVESARKFWREIVGLPEKSYSPAWVELELRPGLLLALHPVFYAKALEKRGYDRGGPVLGIRVMNLDEMGALVERNGARALSTAHPIPNGRSRDFEDPDGYVYELVE